VLELLRDAVSAYRAAIKEMATEATDAI